MKFIIRLVLLKFTLAAVLTGAGYLAYTQKVESTTKLPMISAHRGASQLAPENTLAAFSRAIESGVNFIEIDVRTSSDNVQVIMHDGSLKRTTGFDARVDKTSFAAIKELSAGQWFGDQFKEEKVPTLEEVCVLVRNENRNRTQKVSLYVDCKAINTGEVIRIINQYSLLDSAVFYGDISILKEIRKFSEKARLIPAFPRKDRIERIIRIVKPYAFDIPYAELDDRTVSYCHSKGIKVFSDLLGQQDIPASYRKAISLDVDLIQTDDVSQVLQVYKEFRQTILE